ncbi:MAG: AEC family transporter [Chloroflexota bacterium]
MDQLFSTFTNNLLPIMLIAGTGYFLGKSLSINSRSVGRVIFYVFSPALVLNLLLHNEIPFDQVTRTMSFAGLMFFLTGAIAWAVARLLRLTRPLTIILVLTSMFGNSGNYGLSLVSFAFGEDALAFASIYFVMSAILFNTVGVLIASLGKSSWVEAVKGLARVPTMYAVALAALINVTGFELPTVVERTVTTLADGAIPLMLVLLGLELQQVTRNGVNLRVAGISVAMRLGVGALLGFLLSLPFGLSGPARQAGIIEASVPAAVTNIVLATEYELEPSLVTAIVFFGTILSPLSLTPLLVLLGS